MKERRRPALARRAPHRGLLLALAVAAHDRERRPRLQPTELGLDLAPDRRGEPRVIGIVHVREHQVGPQHDAVLVERVVQRIALVGHRAGDPHHVHAGVNDARDRLGERLGRRLERDHVERRPARSAREHGDAVDPDREVIPDLERAKAGSTEVDPEAVARACAYACARVFARDVALDRDVVERRVAVGVWPPPHRLVDPDRALPPALAQLHRHDHARRPARYDEVGTRGGELRDDLDHTDATLDAGAHPDLADRMRALLEPHSAPRSDRRARRRPPRGPAEQRRA